MSSVFDHPWLGGLFADPEMAALWSAEAQLAGMRAFEAAWSRALGRAGIADPQLAEAAAQVIETISFDLATLREGTAKDGVVVPELVAQMQAAVALSVNGVAFAPSGAIAAPGADLPGGRQAADHTEILRAMAAAVHRGATSQDVIDTALALAISASLDLLDRRLAQVQDALQALTARFADQPLMGRTRMQAATVITVRDRIAPWLLPLSKHRERLTDCRPRVALVQIGGASGDRKALGDKADLIVAEVARQLGLGQAPRAWHTMRDGVAEFAGLLSLISGTLGKMGQDIALMAQQGVDEIALSGGGGSSAMPHKQNPVLAELLVTLARFNAGSLGQMHQALIHEQERSGAAWALEWMVLPQMAEATGRATNAALSLVQSPRRMGSP